MATGQLRLWKAGDSGRLLGVVKASDPTTGIKLESGHLRSEYKREAVLKPEAHFLRKRDL